MIGDFHFGLGLTLLMERIQARGGRFVPLYVRRLLVLLVIGAIHAFLSWVDDILIMYALIGFLLILFRKARPRTLLTWAVILIAIPILFTAASPKALTSSFALGFNVLAMFLIGVWFGKRQVFQNLFAVVIYLVQIPISHWWMKRFRYGPAEWLWRSLTYLHPQPMRRCIAAAQP